MRPDYFHERRQNVDQEKGIIFLLSVSQEAYKHRSIGDIKVMESVPRWTGANVRQLKRKMERGGRASRGGRVGRGRSDNINRYYSRPTGRHQKSQTRYAWICLIRNSFMTMLSVTETNLKNQTETIFEHFLSAFCEIRITCKYPESFCLNNKLVRT